MRLIKKNIFIIQIIIITLLSFFIFTSCGDKNKKDNSSNSSYEDLIEINSLKEVEIGDIYDPKIKTNEGTTIKDIELKRNDNTVVNLLDDYKFNADFIGEYIYKIIVEKDNKSYVLEHTVLVKDSIAPQILEKPNDKNNIEVGLYCDFKNDLSEYKLLDNNKNAQEQIEKKIYSITFNNKEYLLDGNIDEYLLDKVGTYTIKTVFTDVSKNSCFDTYTITTVDNTAPIINCNPVYYVWLKDGRVELPYIDIIDLSQTEVNIKATIDGKSKDIIDNKVVSQLGDEINLEYIAIDEYNNESKAQIKVKVVNYGELINNNYSNKDLFYSSEAIIDDCEKGICVISDKSTSSLEYGKGFYNHKDHQDFSSIEITMENTGKKQGKIVVCFVYEDKVVALDSILLDGKSSNSNKYLIDITKSDLKNIKGIILKNQFVDGASYKITDFKFVEYNIPYIEVVNLKKSYKKGEFLDYDEIIVNGTEITDINIQVEKGNLKDIVKIGDNYCFEESGDYKLDFIVDTGSKKFTLTESINVTNETVNNIQLEHNLKTGLVGELYELPNVNSDITTEIIFNGKKIDLNNKSFIPVYSGKYTVNYKYNNVIVRKEYFAVEEKNTIDFENTEFSSLYNKGFLLNKDKRYVTNGLKSLRVDLESNNYSGGVLKTPLKLLDQTNAVLLDIYSNRNSKIKIKFMFSDDSFVESNVINLIKGKNKVDYLLGKSYDYNFGNKEIKGLIITNEDEYNNIIFLDNIRFGSYISSDKLVVFKDVADFEVEQGKDIIVPNIIACDYKYITNSEIILSLEDFSMVVYEGMSINTTSLENGTYTLKYQITDVYGKKHIKNISVDVVNKTLYGELNLGNYYTNTPFTLPDLKLSSDVYSKEMLEKVETKKYYRVLGSKYWIECLDEIEIENTSTIEVKYVATLENTKIIFSDETYIHTKGVQFDFEKYSGGDHMVYTRGYETPTGFNPPASVSNVWAYDGEYSLYMTADWPWSRTTAGFIAYEKDDPRRVELGFMADTLVFYAYSVADRVPIDLWIDNYDWDWVRGKELINIKKGVHKYVVPLNRPIDSLKRFTFEVNPNEPFYIDNISFVNSVDVEYEDIEGNQYYSGNVIQFRKPTLKNINEFIFTQEDISNIEFSIRLTSNGEVQNYIFNEDVINVNLIAGEYKIEFVTKIAGFEYYNKQNFIVRDIDVEFNDLITIYETNKIYEIPVIKGNHSGFEINAYFKYLNEQDYEKLEVKDNIFTLNFHKSGSGEIKLEVRKNDEVDTSITKIIVRGNNSLSDFELDSNGRHHDEGVKSRLVEFTDEWSYDGKYSMYVSTGGIDFASIMYFNEYIEGYPDSYRKIEGKYNSVVMAINAKKALSDLELQIFTTDELTGDSSWIKSKPMNIPIGEGVYVFEFDQYFSDIYQFGFEVQYNKNTNFYIDALYMYDIQIKEPMLPEMINIKDKIIINEILNCSDDIPNEVVVKYKELGDETYNIVNKVDGKYEITLSKLGVVEIVVEVKITSTFIFSYNIDVVDGAIDPSVDDIVWE